MAALPHDGFAMVTVTVAHLLTLMDLPLHHRDPFDHLLVAQAVVEDAIFVSDDRDVPSYRVRRLPCSG